MISKVKTPLLRAFYITETAIQGWNRDIMMMQIEDDYYKKARPLPHNFDITLPPVNSDLAKAVFKDPYKFGFVDLMMYHTGMTQPLGVAEYQTKKMIEKLKMELPSIDDFESTLND